MMFWRRWAAAVFLLLSAAPVARAVNGSGAMALFYEKDGGRLQLSWLMDPGSLRYTRNEAGLAFAKVITEVLIYRDTTLYQEQLFVVHTTPVSIDDLSAQQLQTHRNYSLRPGLNRIRLRLYQQDAPDEAWVFEDTVRVLYPLPDKPAISTVQLLDTFYRNGAASPFLVKGFQQQPKPFAFYADGERRLSFYLELYKTAGMDTARLPLVCRVGLVKKGDIQLLPAALFYDTLRRSAGSEGIPVRGNISLATVPSGNYFLAAQLLDRNGKEIVRRQTFLQLVNRQPDPVPVDSVAIAAAAAADTIGGTGKLNYLNLAETFVGKYKDEEILSILRMLVPISTELQRATISSFLANPEPIYARYFVYNFFEEKNQRNPEAAWKQYSDKVREVNNLFAGRGGTAYSTDRGLIYLKYGKPTERIQVNNEGGALPYEIWNYRLVPTTGSPGKFLFYQPSRMGNDFKLVHSTVTGEAFDTRWSDKIYPNGGGAVNNSRAQQEFGN